MLSTLPSNLHLNLFFTFISFDIHTIANHRVSFTLHCNYESQYEGRKRRLSALGQGNRWNVGKWWYVLPVLREHAQELFKMQRYEDGKAESTKWLNPFYRSARQFGWRLTTRSRKWKNEEKKRKHLNIFTKKNNLFDCISSLFEI